MKLTRKQYEKIIADLEEKNKGLEEELSAVRAREHILKQPPHPVYTIPGAAVPFAPTMMKTYILYGDGRCEEVTK